MSFIEEKIRKILSVLPSECPTLDYKVKPYSREQDHNFIKDVIAMLNSVEGIGKDKFIIFGVTDATHHLLGIDLEKWRDDNEWQKLADKIYPRPVLQTGTASYAGKVYGYIYISKENEDWVYEVKETVVGSASNQSKESQGVYKGQAFTRHGSDNRVLNEEGRELLREKKKNRLSFFLFPYINFSHKQGYLKAAALLGGWDGEAAGDRGAVQNLYDGDYSTYIEEIRGIHSEQEGVFSLKENIWKLRNQKDLLLELAGFIYDEDIDMFFKVARDVFGDADPKFNIPPDQRFAAYISQRVERKTFSYDLLKGTANTIAILGNFKEKFRNCSRGKIGDSIIRFQQKLFQTNDWKIYATIADQFVCLGEACPDVFLEQIEVLLVEKDAAFLEFLTGEDFDGDQLCMILRMLATKEDYFARSIHVLLRLSEYRERFIDALVEIILPWYPQTEASIATRLGVFRGLIDVNENITWNALVKLMPGNVTTSSSVPKARYLKLPDLPEGSNKRERREATEGFVTIACNMINKDVVRILEILNVYEKVSGDLQDKILSAIKDNAVGLDCKDKAILWNELQDIIHKHRKYSDSKWALSEEEISSLIEMTEWLVPDSSYYESIRLFRQDQYSLLGIRHSYEEEQQKIRVQQIEVLKNVYESQDLESLIAFSDNVEDKYLAGVLSAQLLKKSDFRRLLEESDTIETDDFLKGLLNAYPFDSMLLLIEEFSDEKKAMIFSVLPFTDACIEQAEKLSHDSRNYFWNKTPAKMIFPDSFSNVKTTVERLNACNRAHRSIAVLFQCIHQGITVPEESVIESLQQEIQTSKINQLHKYYIERLMNWLREKRVSREIMIQLEWKFFDLLEGKDNDPECIFQTLSDDPTCFVHILKLLYGNKDRIDAENEEKSEMLSRCFRLKYTWKTTPGMNHEGQLDETRLEEWISEVTKLSLEQDLYNQAMHWFGRVVFYAPADPDGFFINRKVAEYLQNDNDGNMRSGFLMEAINSRGVYRLDPTGKTEFDIEEGYRKKAQSADAAGLYKFAVTLRDLAEYFHDAGARNIEEYKREWTEMT